MSDSYVKLFASITASTIWSEPAGTRLTWITMLAMTNRHGEVFGSVPGIARIANVTLEEAAKAIETLSSPDPWSRTKDHEGRRIEAIDGGWRVLNHAKFDRLRSEIEASEREAERKREWDRENRSKRPNAKYRAQDGGEFTPDVPPTKSDAPPTAPDEIRRPTNSISKELEHYAPHTSFPGDLAREDSSRGGVWDEVDSESGKLGLADQIATELRRRGIRANSGHPDLIAGVAEGVTLREVCNMADAYPGKPANYIIAAARRQHAEGGVKVIHSAHGGGVAGRIQANIEARQRQDNSAVGRVERNCRKALEAWEENLQAIDGEFQVVTA